MTDTAGDELAGVSIMVKGTTNGTISSIDGEYSINAPKNSVLVFSFIGMKSVEENVGNRKIVNVVMTDDNEVLDEVVVVGYGIQKKSSLTSAVSSMKGD